MVASMSDMANSRYMATPGSSHYQVQELANKGFEDAATGLGTIFRSRISSSRSVRIFLLFQPFSATVLGLLCNRVGQRQRLSSRLKSHGDCAELEKRITLFIHVLGWIWPISTLWEIGERGAGV